MCQLSTTAGVANFENRQRAADTQLMFTSSVNPDSSASSLPNSFSGNHYPSWSVQSEQKQRITEEIAQIHADINAALHEHVGTQEELLRTLLSINEEIARLDNSLRSTNGYDGESSLAKNLMSIQNLAAEALDQSPDMLETERNKWLGDFRRALDTSSVSSSVRDQLMGLVEQRRRRGQQLEALATRDSWTM